WRELGLQLVGNGFGDLALNGKDVCQVTIVSLCPEMRIIAGIDQLSVYTHAIVCSLHAALQQMRHRELTSDFAEIACDSALVLHDAGAANDLQVCDLCQ